MTRKLANKTINPLPANAATTNTAIAIQLAQLPTLSMEELWALWDQCFDQRPQHHHRTYVESRLAYRIQEMQLGALPQQIKKRLELIGETGHVPKLTQRDTHQLLPGTLLSREFNGVLYRVQVLGLDAFELNGQRFSSLTAVAKFITGTAWSGPKFFGLPTQSRQAVARSGAHS